MSLKKLISPIIIILSLLIATPVVAANKVNPILFREWNKVAICEEGGNWHHWSSWYPDGLGIDRPNFIQFGGNPNKVNSIAVQIAVAMRFIRYYHMSIPDQVYCHSW